MDPTLPDHLKVIALEWRRLAPDLARWSMERLVNRRDIWVQLGPAPRDAERPYRAVTLPSRSRRGVDLVSTDKLERHYGSFRRNHIVSLHARSADNTCRWLVVDLDVHKPEEEAALAGANWRAASAWWHRLFEEGIEALLLDSNGVGGYHLWTLFEHPVEAEVAFAFGQRLTDDWERYGLPRRPETYPRSAKEGSSGAAMRLPGLHHYRDHITRVWSGEAFGEAWLEGAAAARALLRARPAPITAVSRFAGQPAAPRLATASAADTRRPSYLVDLDGVLARYDGWHGPLQIGAPIDGAREFMRALGRKGNVTVFSSRLYEYDEEAHRVVEEWLHDHDIPFDDIALGKPPTVALIDDRAVPCRPQALGRRAFSAALKRLETLQDPTHRDAAFSRLEDVWGALSAEQRRRILDVLDEAVQEPA